MNKITQTLTFLSCLLFGVSVTAQDISYQSDTISKNNISVTFFGDASMLNLKYERVLSPFRFGFFTASLGAGLGMSGDSRNFLESESFEEKQFFGVIPHHFTANFGSGKHFFEAGIGGTVFTGAPAQDYIGYPILGYRFQNSGNIKSNFRIFVQSPIFENPGPEVLFMPLGFSMGFSLN